MTALQPEVQREVHLSSSANADLFLCSPRPAVRGEFVTDVGDGLRLRLNRHALCDQRLEAQPRAEPEANICRREIPLRWMRHREEPAGSEDGVKGPPRAAEDVVLNGPADLVIVSCEAPLVAQVMICEEIDRNPVDRANAELPADGSELVFSELRAPAEPEGEAPIAERGVCEHARREECDRGGEQEVGMSASHAR